MGSWVYLLKIISAWWRLIGMALLCKLLDRLYPQGNFEKTKSSEVFNFLGVGFESLSCSQWLSNFTVPQYVPWMGHLFVLPASNLRVYRSAGDELCFLPVVNKTGALISHTEKNESTLLQPRRDSSFENPLELWLILRARCLKSRQIVVWGQGKRGPVGDLMPVSIISTVISWWNKLAQRV